MQIFPRLLKEGILEQGHHRVAPCYDPSTGRQHTMDIPRHLESISLTATPDDKLYLAEYISRRMVQFGRQKALYQYNHLSNTWEPRCEMISPRARCGLVYLKGYIYAIGGDDTKVTAERYDLSSDEWTWIPAIPHPMSSELCAVTLNDCIYVICQKGCYCFSTTENKWSKIADMLKPPLHPQAVTYQGSIYCVNSKNKGGYQSSNVVEVYNPTNGEWKSSGNDSYFFDMTTLMEYGDTLYMYFHNHQEQWNTTSIYQYQPETDSWLRLKDEEILVPPLAEWLGLESRTDCLTTRMIPMCLWDPNANGELELLYYDGELSCSSESSGSRTSDNSDGVVGLSDEENT
ncbi:kelch repeat and BTB domain-containing protein 2-like [Branchiostoma floridae]|uniref:Kelch repeat and BTB domain-containing protein 2-like n=1 Tax=Branchiostoma floridae TaxID=7739 RepID=A0A9J7HV81_BRAFL|nr:kelch repeat and BTB domain-containing protein 2-like [Branchiostoma floridae]